MEATANKDVAVIDQQKDLAHLSELEVEITGYKEKFKDLKIDGPEDKDGYEEVRKAIGVLRPKRTGLEAERKSVVKPYNDFVKHINQQYEVITTLIQEGPGGELELKQKKEAVDDILKQQEEEEKRQAELKINNRINELIAAGMVFDGSWYVIGDTEMGIQFTTVGIADIRTMSDLQHQNTLEMVADKSKKIEAEKKRIADIAAKEKADKEERERLEREEFDKQKANMERLQNEMKEKEAELKRQQDKLDADKREAELKEKQVEQDRITGIMRHRSAVLSGIGLKYNENDSTFDYDGEVLIADAINVIEYDDVQWLDLLDKLKAIISNKKFQAEEFLKKQQEEEKEKLRLQEQERLAGMKDKDIMREWIDALLAVGVAPVSTKTWKAKVAMVRDMITDNRPA